MSLKQLRKDATTRKEPIITCPTCGDDVPMSKIPTHHSTCRGWQVAIEDAKKTPRAVAQGEVVKQHLSFSARTFPAIIGSKLVANHWLWGLFTLCSLFFLVGYTFPVWLPPFTVVLPINVVEGLVITYLEVRRLWKPRIFRRKEQ